MPDHVMDEILKQREKFKKVVGAEAKRLGKVSEEEMLAVPITLQAGDRTLKAKRFTYYDAVADVQPLMQKFDTMWLRAILMEESISDFLPLIRKHLEDTGEQRAIDMPDEALREAWLARSLADTIEAPESTIGPAAEIVALALAPFHPDMTWPRLVVEVDTATLIIWCRDVLRASRLLPNSPVGRAEN
jgi:hypothetical protein